MANDIKTDFNSMPATGDQESSCNLKYSTAVASEIGDSGG
jgi:hypothetical protein